MNCKVCGYTLAPRDSTCPNCRVPIRRRWTHKVSLRTIRHLALAFALIVLPLLPHLFEWLQFQLPLRTSPMVREALQRVIDDPRVVAALGQPVRARWSVVGYIRSDETGWSEGRLWIPVWGPKGEGTIYARAGRGAGPWVFTNLECRCKEGAVINFLDVPPAPVGVAPRGQVYLAHLGPPARCRSIHWMTITVSIWGCR
jgi:hypothetical protein